MLAVVKEPRIEIALSGNDRAVRELLDFLRNRYPVSIVSDAEDEKPVNAFSTAFWKDTTPGDLLQGFRLKHGMSQAQLAEKTGIGQTVISAYENGRRPLSRRAAIRIGAALGENADKFFPETALPTGK